MSEPIAIDFSLPRRCVTRRFPGHPGPCPHCGGTLHQRHQTYLVGTRRGEKITDPIIAGNDGGWFCADCPTVVINAEEIDAAFAYPLPDWDLGDQFVVLGILDLDAIPPEQAHLPLGELESLPVIPFDLPAGEEKRPRPASRSKVRPKRAKAKGKSKRKKRRRR